MIIKANEKNLKQIFDYIGEDYCKCIYLYLDLKQYGVNNTNVISWIQYNEKNEIIAVVLKYFTGMHIYSSNPENINATELEELIGKMKPTMICGETNTLKKICLNPNYLYEEGTVRYLDSIICEKNEDVKKAQKSDFTQIAKLLYDDEDIGSSYTLNDLKKQLLERNEQGFTRNYIIKIGEKIVSHAATGAENDKLAMLAYVITDKTYRGMGFAQKVCTAVCKDVINEGKKICLINYSNESTRLYEKIGFKKYCNWSKYYLDLKME